MSETNYQKQIETLRKNLSHCNPYEIQAQLGMIVASIGDAHTAINFPVYTLCPLELYWFHDGIYVTHTSKEYNSLQYKRITHIDGLPIDQITEKLARFISHENQYYLKGLLPKYLPAIEYLYGLQLVKDCNGMKITYEDEHGTVLEQCIPALPFSQYQEALENNRIPVPADELPLYRRYQDRYFWMEHLSSDSIIYFCYRACKNMGSQEVSSFSKTVLSLLDETKTAKLIIDMRNNTGGNSTLLTPLIDALSSHPTINQRGKLFVILGRDTFSSALLNVYDLKTHTKSILVGEPSGGKPNCYGEVKRISLAHFGLSMMYSTKYYHLIEDDSLPALFPDKEIELTIHDYQNGLDPCIEYIKQWKHDE